MITEVKDIKRIDSYILSEYILQNWGPMSHLKLQKILYYIEGYHLAYFNDSVIDDDFQAWVHGPVSKKIYDSLKNKSILHTELTYQKSEGENNPDEVLKNTLTQDQVDFINETVEELSKISSTQLENMTHSEEPWINARRGYSAADRCEVVIDKELMKKYYRQEVYG
ncbi:DUF4065 domain-containing protein [Mucilaginibacter gossypii]|uniref:Panacea domain-containing protein n=1 Tax=Mucilaginibacter gossypii TaxID=551996 RepID=UPI000DCBF522|nr:MULTISPECIES: type II toxin-antitoxin system antitoxin SocA domain-containing protein [Mucilaginibacter]QTE36536.1 DUF4065 domain-containing protein [Mucilaginibacter gossypii]RAV47386.1 hypothetical protein DIU36_29755 [Mucilaginibacter rubeus]